MGKVKSLAIIMIATLSMSLAQAEEFPLRKIYREVTPISTGELGQKLNQVTVVDARSSFEFSVLSVRGAHNIPVNDPGFEDRAKQLRQQTGKPLVFYCNGITCRKSYKATRRALRAGLKDSRVYDAGIVAWAKSHPGGASLLGQSPINVSKIISKSDFKRHLLDVDSFADKAHGSAIVLDVRDNAQRNAIGFFPGKEVALPITDSGRIRNYIAQAKREGKALLIYDAVGKQVRWLQYQIEDMGLKNYYFMKGGAKAYYDTLM